MGVKAAMVRTRTSPAGRRAGAAGFTLVELLVVLVIMGLITAIAVPHFGRLAPRLEARATAREVVSVLRSARGLAIRDNREVAVVVDLDDRFMAIDADRRLEFGSRMGVRLLTGTAELIDGDSGRIRFYPDGTSTGGRVTVSDDGRDYDVRIDWLTGRVTLDD